MTASRKDLDLTQLLEQMIDNELVMGEPKNFVRWMTVGWVVWYLWSDWKVYKHKYLI